eukprot:Protomagalhaensia_sp_Gyna_25__2048@NODE_20_length_7955_cov_303_925088_g13_i0_p10_GENE_NODE_20_length_7955_cov_303_925088_g13_i0NODE_20_length_7955_cov_303_925088_g13_i0_p10_ORF_typecomplete_len129_score31_27Gpatch/PF01585_23/8_1e14Gpatch_2/PF12656_7/1_8e09Gpatch_2/PF12656_7/6_4e03_NODE_20_length_7955_cov_303_925088_g13_i053435729
MASYGEAFLKRFGWKEGEGLGPKKDGIAEPITVRKRAENLGLGAEKEKAKVWDSWWEDVYNQHAANAKPINQLPTNIETSEDDDSENSEQEDSQDRKQLLPPFQDPNQKSVYDLTGSQLLKLCRGPQL